MRWVHPGIVALGGWLLVGGPVAVIDRTAALVWSDVGAGVLLVLLGVSFDPRRTWIPRATALVGVWVVLAPIVIGATSLLAYLHGMVVGTVVLVLALMDRSFVRRR